MREEIKGGHVEQITTILIEAGLDMDIIDRVVRQLIMLIKEEVVTHIEIQIARTRPVVIIKLMEKIEIKVLDFLGNLRAQQMQTKALPT